MKIDLRQLQVKEHRVFLPITANEFRRDFILIANEMMHDSYNETEFIINDTNKEVINQIYYYLVGDKQFNGNFNKGLLLVGNYGTGKTTLLKIVSQIIFKYGNKVVSFVSCVNLLDEIKTLGIEYFRDRPIILDEIGRESQVVKDYGTERHPFQEVLSMRYNSKAWTFGTSNYSLKTFKEMYGGYIEDRMKEMFNVIELKGESFRK